MSATDRAIVARQNAKLLWLRPLLAAARARLKLAPKSPSRARKVKERKEQIARAQHIIARHSTPLEARRYPGSPVPGQEARAATHQTAGLPGYPAVDYFAPAGSLCVAPATGIVTKLSGHDPSGGPVDGPHGPFGWSLYIQATGAGPTYFLTHLGTRLVATGQHVVQGEKIGTVGDYARWGGTNHIHQGVHR